MKDHKNRRILVIDDNQSIHDDFRKILSPTPVPSALPRAEAALLGTEEEGPADEGFEVDTAHQGQEGVALVEAGLRADRRYAVAFIDMRMPPGWDGVETARRIWQLDPEVQIVICTAYSDHSWKSMFEQFGRSDRLLILKKPFDVVEPLQLAHALCEKWELWQQSQSRISDLEAEVKARTAQLEAEIQEHRQAAECLRLSEQRLRHIVEASPAVIYALNKDGSTPTWVSSNVFALTSYTPQEAVRPDWWRTGLHPEDQAACAEQFQQPWNQDRADGEYRFLRKDGHYIWLSDSRALLRNEQGEPVEIVGFWSDIGRRKELEARLLQQQKLESVAKLAGGMAHEFNSHLTTILGYVDLMLMEPENRDSPSQQENLHAIRLSAERSARLVRKLLAYSRKQFLQPRSLNLVEFAQNLRPILQQLMSRSIQVDTVVGEAECPAWADPEQLEEVILHLAMNAREAMPLGGRLSLKTAQVRLEGLDYAELSVSDTGVGMKPEIVARAFEPFFSTADSAPARGLGLAAAYGIIRQSGGDIHLMSTPGQGTTVTLLLPRERR